LIRLYNSKTRHTKLLEIRI